MFTLCVVYIAVGEYSIQLLKNKEIMWSYKTDEIDLSEDIQKVLKVTENLRKLPS